MKATELMIGDWVNIEYGGAGFGFAPVKVVCITEDNTEWLYPIPLTEEILKANGFDIIQDGDSLTIWKQKDDEYGNEVYDITIYASKGVMRFDTCVRFHGTIRKNIYYVHELQHALRLCGLNELADNFKIK